MRKPLLDTETMVVKAESDRIAFEHKAKLEHDMPYPLDMSDRYSLLWR